MRRLPRLSARTLHALSVPMLLICAAGTRAQTAPPAPDPAKVQDALDKIKKLNESVSASTPALSHAKTYVPELQSLTDPSSDAGDFTTRAQAIDKELRTIDTNLLTELSDRSADVQKALDAMPSCDKAVLGDDVAASCTTASTDGQARKSDLDSAKTNLMEQLNGVGPYFKTSLDGPITELAKLDALWSAPNDLPPADFAASVQTFKNSCGVYQNAKNLKDSIYRSLKTLLKADDPTSSDAGAAVTALGDKLKDETGKVNAIFAAFQKTADDNAAKVSDSTTAVAATPIASAQSASDAATAANKAANGIAAALIAWPDLLGSIKSCSSADSVHLAQLREAVKGVQDSQKKLREKLSALNDALEGDPNQFTEEAVPLFFYTEVEKLMRSLNERTDWAGGNSTAATVANSQRELLLDSEGRVEQARGEVADLQFELAKLQEEQRRADAATSLLSLQSLNASRIKKQSDSNLLHATDQFNKAEADSAADPTNAAKKTALQKATDNKNTATAKTADAATKESDAQSKEKDARAQQTSANADKDSLSARIELAKTKLEDAQRNMADLQRSAYRAALTESDAFAAARDQTPYLEGPALSTSLDPVKRVIMRGYPDRNLILLRGKPDDIAAVKRIVSDFDRPAPQARLTLWSTEISAELSKGFLWFKKPADKLNDATAIVDEHLGMARGEMASATTILRQSVNKAVSETETKGTAATIICTQLDILRDAPKGLNPAEEARWRRFRFYSPAVLIQAGLNMGSLDSFRNAVLPDPAATTTVGEALMVLSLSCEENRKRVFNEFVKNTSGAVDELREHLAMLSDRKSGDESKENSGTSQKPNQLHCFPGTAEVLEIPSKCKSNDNTVQQSSDAADPKKQQTKVEAEKKQVEQDKSSLYKTINEAINQCTDQLKTCQEEVRSKATQTTKTTQDEQCADPKTGDFPSKKDEPFLQLSENEGITDQQLEIVRALRAGAARKVLTEMDALRAQIDKADSRFYTYKSKRSFSTNAEAEVTCNALRSEVESTYKRYNRIVNTRFRILYPNDYTDFQLVSKREDFSERVKQQSAASWQKLTEAGPRVAAADEMLKRMMSRLEDDLDQQYVQPMLKKLRADLIRQGLTVGIIQRTSVLATNRLKARVDPKGMYDLSVGEQQDLLASAGQLASIYLSAQTGGALGAFGTLNSLNQKQEQHIYGVTTGNKFEVTPIFDPSGQALRFKFDYVSNSLVRNPKGTVDPTMPSIRHTINTEVQLSNLEIREISRYESNAKLGIPTRYYGGIPLLTDIPGLKPIPLIGWFVRRAGSNAEVQQSIVFGQTTIYPTIGSIVDLLQAGN
ncbi:MAG TPA: hypothetical protein VN025_19205 [Candidatus Dormibacteraeota bacterium]|nr:hypothetical protein [Candidatus Dormibacteraeota bacterium]